MPPSGWSLASWPSLEAQVAAIADDIAYDNHDIDDGLRVGHPRPRRIARACRSSRATGRRSRRAIPGSTASARSRRWSATGSARWSATCSPKPGAASPRPGSRRSTRFAPPGGQLVGFSDAMEAEERALKRHLYAHLYDSAALTPIRRRGAAHRRRPRRRLSRPPRLPARRLAARRGRDRRGCAGSATISPA